MHRWCAWCYVLAIPTFANVYASMAGDFARPVAENPARVASVARDAQAALDHYLGGWDTGESGPVHRAFLLTGEDQEIRFIAPLQSGGDPVIWSYPTWRMAFPAGCGGPGAASVHVRIAGLPDSVSGGVGRAAEGGQASTGSGGWDFQGDVVMPPGLCERVRSYRRILARPRVGPTGTERTSFLKVSLSALTGVTRSEMVPTSSRARYLVWLEGVIGIVLAVLFFLGFGAQEGGNSSNGDTRA